MTRVVSPGIAGCECQSLKPNQLPDSRVKSQHGAGNFFLQEVEDFVNVSFFIKFLLLFWRHGAG